MAGADPVLAPPSRPPVSAPGHGHGHDHDPDAISALDALASAALHGSRSSRLDGLDGPARHSALAGPVPGPSGYYSGELFMPGRLRDRDDVTDG